jgi:hypothetical protein
VCRSSTRCPSTRRAGTTETMNTLKAAFVLDTVPAVGLEPLVRSDEDLVAQLLLKRGTQPKAAKRWFEDLPYEEHFTNFERVKKQRGAEPPPAEPAPPEPLSESTGGRTCVRGDHRLKDAPTNPSDRRPEQNLAPSVPYEPIAHSPRPSAARERRSVVVPGCTGFTPPSAVSSHAPTVYAARRALPLRVFEGFANSTSPRKAVRTAASLPKCSHTSAPTNTTCPPAKSGNRPRFARRKS